MPGSMAEEIVKTAKETLSHALSVIDTFRPKILVKQNLSELISGQARPMRPLDMLRERAAKRLGTGLLGQLRPGEEAAGQYVIIKRKDSKKTVTWLY